MTVLAGASHVCEIHEEVFAVLQRGHGDMLKAFSFKRMKPSNRSHDLWDIIFHDLDVNGLFGLKVPITEQPPWKEQCKRVYTSSANSASCGRKVIVPSTA